MPRLKLLYENTLKNDLYSSLNLSNIMQVPRIIKIVLSMGVGKVIVDKKLIDNAVRDLSLISGQKAIVRKAKKPISGFKIKKGYPIGCKVTLRGSRMYFFLDNLISISIPRIRDFRGFSVRSFDGFGNYSFGIEEQIVFPELPYDSVDIVRGLNVTIVTSTVLEKEAYCLLKAFSFPFRDKVL